MKAPISRIRDPIVRAALALAVFMPTSLCAQFKEGRAFVLGYHVDSGGVVIAEIGETGAIARVFGAPYQLQNVTSLVFLPDGNLAAVAGTNALAYLFSPKGTLIGVRQLFASSSGGATLTDDGNLLVAIPGQDSLSKVFAGFATSYSLVGLGGSLPYDVEFDPFGRALYTSSGSDRIHRYEFPLGNTAEELGDDASCTDVRRLTVTPRGDVFAVRNGADTVTFVDESGSTIESVNIDGDTPTDITMAPDGTVAVISSATREIVHLDPFARTVARRVGLPTTFFPLYFAYAPSRFVMKVKGVSVNGDDELAPKTIKMSGVTAAFHPGSAFLVLDIPWQYAAEDVVSTFCSGPIGFRLASLTAATGPTSISGFGTAAYGRFSASVTIELDQLSGNITRTRRISGAFDYFDEFQSHFRIGSAKKLK